MKPVARNVVSNPLSALPSDLTKENTIHQDQVISPLTQSAQRFPFYVRDSIMTPRCRKPVFTFSPIDEPSDDLVPNSDTLQLANMIHQPQSVQETNKAVDDISLTEDSENSILSGCALIQESKGSLTSPFKKYLMNREIEVFDESGQQEDEAELSKSDSSLLDANLSKTEPPLLDSDHPISESLLEFLDGNGQDSDSYPHSSPTRPSPPMTKSILFETSL